MYNRVDFEQIRFFLGCVCWENLRPGKHMSPDYFPTSHKTILRSVAIVEILLQATDLKLDAELLSENRVSGGTKPFFFR